MTDTTLMYFKRFCNDNGDAVKLIDYLTVHLVEDDTTLRELVTVKRKLLENEKGEL